MLCCSIKDRGISNLSFIFIYQAFMIFYKLYRSLSYCCHIILIYHDFTIFYKLCRSLSYCCHIILLYQAFPIFYKLCCSLSYCCDKTQNAYCNHFTKPYFILIHQIFEIVYKLYFFFKFTYQCMLLIR